jgi:hypothetical protein
MSFLLDAFSPEKLVGSQYRFDSYDVIAIYSKHFQFISLDDWIVCKSVDAKRMPALIYGKKTFIEKMHNNPVEVGKASAIISRYDFNHNIINFSHNDKNYVFDFDNIKFMVNYDSQKVDVAKDRDDLIFFMPELYSEILLKNDESFGHVKGIKVDFFMESQSVLVNKNSKNYKFLIDTIRKGFSSYEDLLY